MAGAVSRTVADEVSEKVALEGAWGGDPAEAWSAYEPTAEAPWNRERVAHLYRRVAYGASWSELEAGLARSPQELVRELVEGRGDVERFEREMESLTASVRSGDSIEAAQGLWIYRMLHSPHPLRETLTLIWHNRFATSATKVRSVALMQRQNELLRAQALGKFDELLWLMTIDAAMLVWLDATSNRKGHPNENYARELMELFSLGVGQYSERDIQEAARALTGWTVKEGRSEFRLAEFDAGVKTIFGQTGAWQARDVVRLCAAQPACAWSVVRNLVAEFVGPDFVVGAAGERLLAPLVQAFRDSELDVKACVARILGSRLFFSEAARWTIVKSPVALVVGLVKSLEGRVGPEKLVKACDGLGQSLLKPPSVKGWDGGAEWINSTTLLRRQNLAFEATRGTGDVVRLDPARLADKYDLDGHDAIATFFLQLFLQRDDPEVHETLVAEMNRVARDPGLVLAGKRSRAAVMRTAAHLAMTLPEFQLR